MREYRLWSRRARKGDKGYATEASSDVTPPAMSKGALYDARAGARPDPSTRRRRVLEMLVGLVAVPGLVALATGSSTAWWVFVGMLPIFGFYLAVVFYARRVRAEREINVAFFGGERAAGKDWEEVFSSGDPHLDEISA